MMNWITRILILALIAGCSSAKKMENQPSEAEKKMLAAGFLMGTVIAEPNGGGCPYTIEVAAETPYYLDPLNLMEYYQKDGKKIWFKFQGLRMMNRCEKANPVSIQEIQERAE